MPYRYEATQKFWAGFYDLNDSQKESVRRFSALLARPVWSRVLRNSFLAPGSWLVAPA
jgi:hypothetical protein